jgi:hypothetical protein
LPEKESPFMFGLQRISFLILSLIIAACFAAAQPSKQVDAARKIEEAEPKALPQSPVVKKLTSDAQDRSLKGNVKLVIEETEYLTKTSESQSRIPVFETYFNEAGMLVKEITYNAKGNPSKIDVYGYLDGARVASSAKIKYESQTQPATNTEKLLDGDKRYDSKYEYKYDEKGFLKERLLYRNDGVLNSKIIYNRVGDKIEQLYYDDAGKIYTTAKLTLDERGNVTENISGSPNSQSPPNIITFSYYSFDENGNWTKRVVFRKAGQLDGSYEEQLSVQYRKITYYP